MTKAEAFGLGASDYIVKLPDPIELIARIRHHSSGYIAQLERNETYAALVSARAADGRASTSRSLLPKPMQGPIATDWRFMPSVQLGGDAFGYHELDAITSSSILLDVSGHGVKSALLSVTAMNALRTRSLVGRRLPRPGRRCWPRSTTRSRWSNTTTCISPSGTASSTARRAS